MAQGKPYVSLRQQVCLTSGHFPLWVPLLHCNHTLVVQMVKSYYTMWRPGTPSQVQEILATHSSLLGCRSHQDGSEGGANPWELQRSRTWLKPSCTKPCYEWRGWCPTCTPHTHPHTKGRSWSFHVCASHPPTSHSHLFLCLSGMF